MNQSVLIIAGHPRSGTSFTASLLQSAGLHLGHDLMAPGHGNVKGFFEDWDFVKFHEAVLQAQGIHHVGWTVEENIVVDDKFKEQAQALIANNSFPLWGWKDPRTTLFLNFWQEILPEANFLLLYRSPWEVADSIYRRGDDLFREQPDLAIKIWIHYNKLVLDFYDKYPNRCFISSVYTVSQKAPTYINALNSKLNLNLAEPADLYEPALLQTQGSNAYHSSLINAYFPEAINIYQELNNREKQCGLAPDQHWQENIQSTLDYSWAFQDWIKIKRLETKVKHLQAELEKNQAQLSNVSSDEILAL